jgi:hypothetical protein
MRFFRYGGVNVTFFLPKSAYMMDPSIDPKTADPLSLPSVWFIKLTKFEKKTFFFLFSLKRKHLLMLYQSICEL